MAWEVKIIIYNQRGFLTNHGTLLLPRGGLRWRRSYIFLQLKNANKYRKTSNISRTFVGNKIVDHSDVVGASLAALLQLHLHSRLNIWLQGIRQRQPQGSTRIF